MLLVSAFTNLVRADMKKTLTFFLSIFCFASLAICQEADPDNPNDHEPKIKSIYFGGGSYTIDSKQANDVLEWLDGIENIHMYQITIKSHTDNIGSKRFNQYLSEMRSESAFLLLQQFPTDLFNIRVNDYGEQAPDFRNNSRENQFRNRRVDIILMKVNS